MSVGWKVITQKCFFESMYWMWNVTTTVESVMMMRMKNILPSAMLRTYLLSNVK